ncbi:MAG: hypothetical protein ACLSUW_02775 [Akkermansia sp.]
MPSTPSYRKYGRAGCTIFPIRMLTPYGTGSLNALSALSFLPSELCALPRPLNMKTWFFSRRTLEELPWAPADRLVLKEWLEEHR